MTRSRAQQTEKGSRQMIPEAEVPPHLRPAIEAEARKIDEVLLETTEVDAKSIFSQVDAGCDPRFFLELGHGDRNAKTLFQSP